jgi:hypothetical protein
MGSCPILALPCSVVFMCVLLLADSARAETHPAIEIGSDITIQSGVAKLPITLTGAGDEFAIA